MIVVSAALEDGTLWPGASPRGVHVGDVFIQDDNDPRLPEGTSLGWIEVYAPGYDMPSCSIEDGETLCRPRQTSGAAAQVVSYSHCPASCSINQTIHDIEYLLITPTFPLI